MNRAALCLCLCALGVFAQSPKDQHFFDMRVAPILTKRCLGCHNHQLDNGGISFEDRETLIRSGRRGPVIVPGNPEKSVLILALQHEGELQMPPGPKLPAKEIKILTDWIRRGAVWGKVPKVN